MSDGTQAHDRHFVRIKIPFPLTVGTILDYIIQKLVCNFKLYSVSPRYRPPMAGYYLGLSWTFRA